MAETSIFLIPEGFRSNPEDYARQAQKALVDMGVISNENYGDLPTWFQAGRNSLAPFEAGEYSDQEIGFEYCVIYGAKRKMLVPDVPAAEPRCPKCSKKLSEDFYQLVNDIDERLQNGTDRVGTEFEDARMRCSKCGSVLALNELKDPVGIFITDKYISFDEVCGPLRKGWLQSFNRSTGIEHKSFAYGYT
jgi:hypothetical protein